MKHIDLSSRSPISAKPYQTPCAAEAGMTLVEAMVAIGIISVLFMSALPFFTQQNQILSQFTSNGSCQVQLEQIQSKILNQYGTRLSYASPDINNTTTSLGIPGRGGGLTTPVGVRVAKRFNFFAIKELSESRPSKVLQLSNPNRSIFFEKDGVQLFTPLLLDGPMAYAGDLYNGVTNTIKYCDAFRKIPAELNPTVMAGIQGKYELKIERYNLGTNVVLKDCAQFWPRPLNGEVEMPDGITAKESGRLSLFLGDPVYKTPDNQINVWTFPDWIRPNEGFKISLRAEVVGESGTTSCAKESFLGLPADFHNVVDINHDFDFIKQDVYSIVDKKVEYDTAILTSKTSDKKEKFAPILNSLPANRDNWNPYYKDALTFFTNLGIVPDRDKRQRQECSQGTNLRHSFALKLVINKPDVEPGLIPLCLDDSNQLLRTADPNGMVWCGNNKSGPSPNSATVHIAFNNATVKDPLTGLLTSVPKSQGWVPCEQLTLCGQKPDSKTLKRLPNGSLEYILNFSAINSNNLKEKNKLWGCDVNYKAALVDLAGNLAYPIDQEATRSINAAYVSSYTNNGKVPPCDPSKRECLKPAMKNITPKIYFKPPPCYNCECKNCGTTTSGKDFTPLVMMAAFLLIAVIGVLAPAAIMAIIGNGYLLMGIGALATSAGICMGTNLCRTKDTIQNPTGVSSEVACDKAGGNALCPSCGANCAKVKAPSPPWSDNLKNDNDALTCAPVMALPLCPLGVTAPGCLTFPTDPTSAEGRFALRASNMGAKIATKVQKIIPPTTYPKINYDYLDKRKYTPFTPIMLTEYTESLYTTLDFNTGTMNMLNAFCRPNLAGTEAHWAVTSEIETVYNFNRLPP